eukprot:gnl/TRDRNA2_/TRDRNA2_186835_c0_seq1.p1 gnl/TRDRNA2_/TRDRNA2_186835_c0~~gnl/TRDRNA2_/TRDRNA2_186835_c0_seq1.p1  ORF type:complete len:221 (+),score=33.96 gnl/TRDRNA2_/TRDRNA2_186835_c0_seq1:49-711(+)
MASVFLAVAASTAMVKDIHVRRISGELVADLPGDQRTVQEVLHSLVSQSPPPKGMTYQLLSQKDLLGGELPDERPLELTVVTIEDWSGTYHKRSVGYGGGARAAYYNTDISFRNDGSVMCASSGTNGWGGRKSEATGSWVSPSPGLLEVRLTAVRSSDMRNGAYGSWTTYSPLKQHLEFEKSDANLKFVCSQVDEGEDFFWNKSFFGVGAIFVKQENSEL